MNFTKTEPYIQSFWSVVEGWDEECQKKLLQFVTAAERVPVSGQLLFRISKQYGEEGLGKDGALPRSSTCISTLYLPVYESTAVMEGKLRTALSFGVVGFGLA